MNTIYCSEIAATFDRQRQHALSRSVFSCGIMHASERAAAIHAERHGKEVARVDGGRAPAWLALNRDACDARRGLTL
jgi:hypothetical protein